MLAFSLYRPAAPYEVVDILVHSPILFSQAKKRRVCIRAAGLRLNLVSIDDLIAMKRVAGREQDLSDIQALKKVKKAMAR